MGAAAGMNFSSVSVIGHALRLRHVQLKTFPQYDLVYRAGDIG